MFASKTGFIDHKNNIVYDALYMTNAEHSPTLAELHQQLVTIRKRQLHIEANENPIERTQQEDELSELTDWLEAQIAAFPHQDE